jgi:hypothetical protein
MKIVSRRGLAAVVFWAGLGAALAQTETRPVLWNCWLGGALDKLHCAEEAAAVPAAQQGGTPGDHKVFLARLFERGQSANVTRVLRQDPAAWSGRTWTIPLHGPAFDTEHVIQLARAVMCGREAQCSVRMVER